MSKESTPAAPTSTEIKKTEEKFTEFIPFGSRDKIKLSAAIVRRLIAVPTSSGKTCSDDDAIKFIAMCRAKALNPFEGDAFLIGYDTQTGPKFSLITAHQAFLKRAEVNKEYDGMKSGVIIQRGPVGKKEIMDVEGDFHLEDDVVVGGWAKVFFKNRTHPMERRIRLNRFKKNTKIWNEDPAGMICKCAEADALRSSFPTMLGGLYTKEEMINSDDGSDSRTKKPIFPTAATTTDVESVAVEDPIVGIMEMADEEGVTVPQILAFLCEAGLAKPENKTLQELKPESIQAITDCWPDMVARIKGEK